MRRSHETPLQGIDFGIVQAGLWSGPFKRFKVGNQIGELFEAQSGVQSFGHE